VAAEEDIMVWPAFVEMDGKRILWRDLLQLRREQRKALTRAAQPTLFELKEDRRPAGDRNAAERYLEPNLFARLEWMG
jgi:hypothetical protein